MPKRPLREQTSTGEEIIDEGFEGGMTGASGGGGFSASGEGGLTQSGGDPEHLEGWVMGTPGDFARATGEAIVDGAMHIIGHHGMVPIVDMKVVKGEKTPDGA